MAIKSVLAPIGRFIARSWGWLDISRRFFFNLSAVAKFLGGKSA